MRRALHALAAAALLLLLGSAEGLAQGVNVIGAVTPGHCVSFFSTSQIQDSGSACGGGGGGITGPGASTVGDLAVWNNTTGTVLADTNLSFPGGFSFAGTLTGATAVTFPTSGTLATTATANVASVTGTTGQVTVSPTTGAVVVALPATITANLILSGTVNHTGPFQVGGNTMTFPATAQTLAGLATPQTWAAVQTFGNSDIALTGASTGVTTFTSANAGASNFTLTFPAVTANLAYLVGTPVSGNCVKFSGTVGGLTDSGGVCGGGGTPGGANTNIQFNNSSAFGGDSGFTYAGNGQVTHALGTITTNLKALNITGTWNNAAVTFDAPLFMNIVNTASNSASLLMDLQVGGNSALAVVAAGPILVASGGLLYVGTSAGAPTFVITGTTIQDYGGLTFSTVFGTADSGLQRIAAKVLSFSDGAANTNGWLQWGGEARVTSDFSVTSSVALVNVTGLSVNVAAGRTYSFVTELYVTDAAAGGVQAAIAGTATATAIQYTGYTIADNAIKGKTNATALATAVGSTVTTETAGIIVRISGIITVNVAGTLTVQMAQNTSNGTATIAKRGSWLIVNDMP